MQISRAAIAGAVLCTVAVVCGVSAPDARAHSLGASFEATSSAYLIDIGYDPVDFVAGYSSRFDLELRNAAREMQDFGHVWVRITKDDRTVLATGVAQQDLGPTSLLYVFETPGTYELNASYRNDSGVIAEAAFPITVTADPALRAFPTELIAVFAAGLTLGVGISVAWGRRKRLVDRA